MQHKYEEAARSSVAAQHAEKTSQAAVADMQGQLAAAERKCAQAETVCGELKASAQDTETTVREVREFASALGQENEELERQYVQARRDLQAALDDKELLTSRELEESMARENLETSLRDLEEEVEAKQTHIGKASRQAEDLAERCDRSFLMFKSKI